MYSKFRQEIENRIIEKAQNYYRQGLSVRQVRDKLLEDGFKKSHTWVWLQIKSL